MIAMVGGVCGWLDDENRGQENQTDVFDYFGAIFVTHQGSCDDCDRRVGGVVYGWLGDENRDRNNQTNVFNFFRP